MSEQVNRVPGVGKWIFQTWKIDFYNLTPFELDISAWWIVFTIRTGRRVFKWEYRRKEKQE